jgi:hypothetical protein
MPAVFRADRAAGWNRPIRSKSSRRKSSAKKSTTKKTTPAKKPATKVASKGN